MAMAPRATLLLALSLLAMAAVASAHGGYETCPSELHFTKCVNVLGLGINLEANEPYKLQKQYCCPLIEHVVDADAALCLCKRLYLAGVVDLTIQVRVILNNCGKYCPTDFKCPTY